MRYVMLCLVLGACAHPIRQSLDLGGTARDTIAVTYLSGRVPTPNWHNATERPYGRLVVGDTAMMMESDKGTTLFVLPLRSVRETGSTVEQQMSTVTGPSRAELLTITTTQPDVLTFRVRRAYTSQAFAAKLNARLHR